MAGLFGIVCLLFWPLLIHNPSRQRPLGQSLSSAAYLRTVAFENYLVSTCGPVMTSTNQSWRRSRDHQHLNCGQDCRILLISSGGVGEGGCFI